MLDSMKHTLLLSSLGVVLCAMVISAAPPPPSALTIYCGRVEVPLPFNASGNCPQGQLVISGTDYPHNVQVTINTCPGTGESCDPGGGEYYPSTKETAPMGNLSSQQFMAPAGRYEVIASRANGPDRVYARLIFTVDQFADPQPQP